MCVSYVGGKSKIAPQLIIPNIPKDIETFVEPFSGQFWTFFKMNLEDYPNLKTVVYNDFNPLNYNMYQCIQNHQRLLEECEKFIVQEKSVFPTNPICEEQFNRFQTEIFADNFKVGPYDYVVAAKYIYVLTQVFSGANPSKSKFIDLKGKYHSKFTSFMNKLKKLPLLVIVLAIFGCTNDSDSNLLKTSENENITYTEVIKTIMDQKCNSCHGATPSNGAPMSLNTYETVKEAVLNRGLIERISLVEGQSGFMPLGGSKLPQTQIDAIIQWQNDDFPL